ncbi:hypothetical protein Nepgr_018102 [Nepenthes gracilis]|uniref:Uncharacterized protein n=1 Tax=Nepenthes gracilis TaxID=150966 RepID=A0AAD3XU01_NEPGR|nr:hypothetical protein Nepgr_018102 [Nepenthes gracilis]
MGGGSVRGLSPNWANPLMRRLGGHHAKAPSHVSPSKRCRLHVGHLAPMCLTLDAWGFEPSLASPGVSPLANAGVDTSRSQISYQPTMLALDYRLQVDWWC